MRLDVSPDTFRNVHPRGFGGFVLEGCGRHFGTRTRNFLLVREALYPLELRAHVVEVAGVEPALFLCAKQMPSH
jgi:hypothetical protein